MDTEHTDIAGHPDRMLRHAAELFNTISSDTSAAEHLVTQLICDTTDEVLAAQLMGLQALLQRIGTTSDRAADGLGGTAVRSTDMWQGMPAEEAFAALRRRDRRQ